MKIPIKRIITETILDDIGKELQRKLDKKRDLPVLNKNGDNLEVKPLEDLYNDEVPPLKLNLDESVLFDTKNKLINNSTKNKQPNTTESTKELSKLGLANTDRGNLQVFKGQVRHTHGKIEEGITNWRDKRTKVISAADKLALSKKDVTIPAQSKSDLSSHYAIQQKNPTRNPKPGQKFLLRDN